MKLIKRLNEELKETQVEQANPFKYLDVNNTRGINDILEDVDSDVKKLIKQYKDKDIGEMSDREIKDMIGDDLEMLEYDPEETNKLIKRIFKELKNETGRDNT